MDFTWEHCFLLGPIEVDGKPHVAVRRFTVNGPVSGTFSVEQILQWALVPKGKKPTFYLYKQAEVEGSVVGADTEESDIENTDESVFCDQCKRWRLLVPGSELYHRVQTNPEFVFLCNMKPGASCTGPLDPQEEQINKM